MHQHRALEWPKKTKSESLNLDQIARHGNASGGVCRRLPAAISYAMLCVAMFIHAQRLFPLRFELGKIAHALSIAAVLYGAASWAAPAGLVAGAVVKLALVATFLPLLYITGFFDHAERDRLRSGLRQSVPMLHRRNDQDS